MIKNKIRKKKFKNKKTHLNKKLNNNLKMSEIEATISRINSYDGVERILIIKSSDTEDGQNFLLRSLSNGNDKDKSIAAEKFAQKIPQIGKEARSMIRQLDPKVILFNFLKFKI